MVKSDKPIPDGVFWMVWDESNNYGDRTLCPTKLSAKLTRDDNRELLYEGDWVITKVKVTSL